MEKTDMITKYANWLLSECNEPIDEIEWLVNSIPKEKREDLLNTISEHFKE